MEFLTVQKKQNKLIYEEYIYVFHKELANKLRSFKCLLRRKGQCKGKVKGNLLGYVVERLNEHTHAPSEKNMQSSLIKNSDERSS